MLGRKVLIREESRCSYSGNKKVTASFYRDEPREPVNAIVKRLGLNGELSIISVVTGDWISVIVQAIEGGIVDPNLLDELKLAAQISIECDEKDTLIEFGGWRGRILGQLAKFAPSTDYAVAPRYLRRPPWRHIQRVARIGTAYM